MPSLMDVRTSHQLMNTDERRVQIEPGYVGEVFDDPGQQNA